MSDNDDMEQFNTSIKVAIDAAKDGLVAWMPKAGDADAPALFGVDRTRPASWDRPPPEGHEAMAAEARALLADPLALVVKRLCEAYYGVPEVDHFARGLDEARAGDYGEACYLEVEDARRAKAIADYLRAMLAR